MHDSSPDKPVSDVTLAPDSDRTRSADRFGKKSAAPADAAVGRRPESDTPKPAATPDTVVSEASEHASPPPTAAPNDTTPDVAQGSADRPAEQSVVGPEQTQELAPSEAEPTENEDQTAGMREIEAEVRISDGATYVGTFHIREDEEVLDFLNTPKPFFSLVETSGKVRLLCKSQVLQVVPYEKGTGALRGGGALM